MKLRSIQPNMVRLVLRQAVVAVLLVAAAAIVISAKGSTQRSGERPRFQPPIAAGVNSLAWALDAQALCHHVRVALQERGPYAGQRLPFVSEVPGIVDREGMIDEWVMGDPKIVGTPWASVSEHKLERVLFVWVALSLEGMLMPRGDQILLAVSAEGRNLGWYQHVPSPKLIEGSMISWNTACPLFPLDRWHMALFNRGLYYRQVAQIWCRTLGDPQELTPRGLGSDRPAPWTLRFEGVLENRERLGEMPPPPALRALTDDEEEIGTLDFGSGIQWRFIYQSPSEETGSYRRLIGINEFNEQVFLVPVVTERPTLHGNVLVIPGLPPLNLYDPWHAMALCFCGDRLFTMMEE